MNVRPSATTGDACPVPTGTIHALVGRSGHDAGGLKTPATPVRDGPRHWFQSCAEAADTATAIAVTTRAIRSHAVGIDPSTSENALSLLRPKRVEHSACQRRSCCNDGRNETGKSHTGKQGRKP